MVLGSLLTRRSFLWTSGAALAGIGYYTWQLEPHWVEVVEHDLPVENLPSPWQGRRVVQVSDLHVGKQVDPNYLRQVIRSIADLEPDLILLTGDFTTAPAAPQFDEVARLMAELRPAPLGALAVLGNHDYGYRYQNHRAADRICSVMREEGIEALRNEVRTIDGLQFLGVDDYWGCNFDPHRAVKQLDRDQPSVVLCHNPDVADLDVWDGYRGWMLSGHTHGGQCKPPFLPPPLLPVKNRRYVAGRYDLDPGRWLYINRGIGHLIPVRFNVRPEITVHRMVAA